MLEIITLLILVFGIFNLVRLTIFMIAADIYDIRQKKQLLKNKRTSNPIISVLIPAFNEELTIEKTVLSVLAADYRNKEIIVIDDGSTDNTSNVVKGLQKKYSRSNLKLITQKNAGKGSALNAGIKQAKGELVMVLDADSTISKDALKNSVRYFSDKNVKAIAASVNLENSDSWLGILQKIEYTLSYRMKRSLTTLNIEYIIGGVGSVYRMSTLKQVFGYRRNTITEDIDLSMKVVARGNRGYRIVFASDVRASTEPVHSFRELVAQRYRWKLGRLQSFARYRHMFYSKSKKHNRLLTWFQLPYAIFGELYLMLEPLFIGAIIFVTIAYSDVTTLPTAMLILSVYIVFNIIASTDESKKNKAVLVYLTPAVYFMLPVLSLVELLALLKSFKNWRRISPEFKGSGHWIHVTRKPANYQTPKTA